MAADVPYQPAQLLSLLDPLLHTPIRATMISVLTALNANPPSPQLLANALNFFIKFIPYPPSPPTTNSHSLIPARKAVIRELVTNLRTSALLGEDLFLQFIDAESMAILEISDRLVAIKRARTREWFTQSRFNLFREEAQGYAELTTTMWSITSDDPSPNPEEFLADIHNLIGKYCLDSNRVIEMALAVAAELIFKSISDAPRDRAIHPCLELLLDQFLPDHIIAMVGAMLQAYQPHESHLSSISLSDMEHASRAVVALVAVMIRHGRMSVGDVWPFLSPMDMAEFEKAYDLFAEEATTISREVSRSRMLQAPSSSGRDASTPRRQGTGPSHRDVYSQYPLLQVGPGEGLFSQKLELIIFLCGMCRWQDARTAILCLNSQDCLDVGAIGVINRVLVGFAETLLNPVLCTEFPDLVQRKTSITSAISKLAELDGYAMTVDSVEELFNGKPNGPGDQVRQMLLILGPNLRSSPSMLVHLCRLMRGRTDDSAYEIMKEVVLPSFATLVGNTNVGDEIWKTIESWDQKKRWMLYAFIRYELPQISPAYNAVAGRAAYESKYILKRLTLEVVRKFSDAICKLTHGQALIYFGVVLDRIQGYPADPVTVTPIVEASKKCSPLALDMFLYLILDRMSSTKRSRLKKDGINAAQWYATVSLLLGIVLRKMPVTEHHVAAVFKFFYTRLIYFSEPLIIIALNDVLKCAADVDVDVNMSESQILAHGGGPLLLEILDGVCSRLRPGAYRCGKTFDTRGERERQSVTSMLLSSLDKSKVHLHLGIALGQLTRDSIFHEEFRAMPLKLGANIVDLSWRSLLRLSAFLDSSLPKATAGSKASLWKPFTSMGLGNIVEKMDVPTSAAVGLMRPVLDFLAEANASKASEIENGGDATTATDKQDFSSVISARSGLTPWLVKAFWFMELKDLYMPADIYDVQHARMKSVMEAWKGEIENHRRRDRAGVDKEQAIQMEGEFKRVCNYVEGLENEKTAAQKHQDQVAQTLREMKDDLKAMTPTRETREAYSHAFLRECVLPRCFVSKPDALFCVKFVQLMMSLDIGIVDFEMFFRQMFDVIPIVIRGCSENEALCFSLLGREVLTLMERWRSNKKVFEMEAGKQNGFCLRHEQFCQWLFGVHESLSEGLSVVLASSEYLHSRNTLSLLNDVVDVFPKVSEHAWALEKCIKKLKEADLEDIQLTATGVLARLQTAMAKRIPEHIFMLKPIASGMQGGPRGSSLQPLSALAKEFVPAVPGRAGDRNGNKRSRPTTNDNENGGEDANQESKGNNAISRAPEAKRIKTESKASTKGTSTNSIKAKGSGGGERKGRLTEGNRYGSEAGRGGRGGNDRGGNDRGGNDRGGNDRGGNDRGGNDRGGNDRGGNDRGGGRVRGGGGGGDRRRNNRPGTPGSRGHSRGSTPRGSTPHRSAPHGGLGNGNQDGMYDGRGRRDNSNNGSGGHGPHREEGRRDQGRREQGRREEGRRDEALRDEPWRDERGAPSERGDGRRYDREFRNEPHGTKRARDSRDMGSRDMRDRDRDRDDRRVRARTDGEFGRDARERGNNNRDGRGGYPPSPRGGTPGWMERGYDARRRDDNWHRDGRTRRDDRRDRDDYDAAYRDSGPPPQRRGDRRGRGGHHGGGRPHRRR